MVNQQNPRMLRIFLMQFKEIIRVLGNQDQAIGGGKLKVNIIGLAVMPAWFGVVT